MDWWVYIILGIIIIGALAIFIPLLGIGMYFWYITLPILGALVGGWIGFFFGVGLTVIIFGIVELVKKHK